MANDVSVNDFGLLIAYIVPGFLALWGGTYLSPTISTWVGQSPDNPPTIGGFLYVTIASVAAGMTVSTIRWLLIDTFHHRTGLGPPQLNFSRFERKTTAFGVLIDIHYKYYLFHANMLVALAVAYVARRIALGFWTAPLGWTDLGFVILEVVFFLGSRDTLRKYYTRTGQLLGMLDAVEPAPPLGIAASRSPGARTGRAAVRRSSAR